MAWVKDPSREITPNGRCSLVPNAPDGDRGCLIGEGTPSVPVKRDTWDDEEAQFEDYWACVICWPKIEKYGSS